MTTLTEPDDMSPEQLAGDLKTLSQFGTATLHEALGQRGALASAIKPIGRDMTLIGTALTIRTKPGDNLAIHQAVASAQPGEVLVVDYDGSEEFGPFGDVLATAARARGVIGLVIDGRVRDGRELREMGFPVFCRGLSIKATAKLHKGTIGEPVVCGGITVYPGDIVAGDEDGVVVIPRSQLKETLRKSREREDMEEDMRKKLRAGATTLELLRLDPIE